MLSPYATTIYVVELFLSPTLFPFPPSSTPFSFTFSSAMASQQPTA